MGLRRPPPIRSSVHPYSQQIGGLGTFFEMRLLAASSDGAVESKNGILSVTDASTTVLIVAAATSFNGYDRGPSKSGLDPSSQTRQALARIEEKSYEQLKQSHHNDYQALFKRVFIDLGSSSQHPTDERVRRFAKGGDPGLAALLFQFGRYLRIAASRPGGQPLNLQGIWNPLVIPPWAGAYTTNINLEMNYWAGEVANLPECQEPLFQALDEFAVKGRSVSRKMYHRRGWVITTPLSGAMRASRPGSIRVARY